jgi:hypothetical protein
MNLKRLSPPRRLPLRRGESDQMVTITLSANPGSVDFGAILGIAALFAFAIAIYWLFQGGKRVVWRFRQPRDSQGGASRTVHYIRPVAR